MGVDDFDERLLAGECPHVELLDAHEVVRLAGGAVAAIGSALLFLQLTN
ncbi:MAG: hypothetical protein WCI73_18435 [Phycisphaerae bacterium]